MQLHHRLHRRQLLSVSDHSIVVGLTLLSRRLLSPVNPVKHKASYSPTTSLLTRSLNIAMTSNDSNVVTMHSEVSRQIDSLIDGWELDVQRVLLWNNIRYNAHTVIPNDDKKKKEIIVKIKFRDWVMTHQSPSFSFENVSRLYSRKLLLMALITFSGSL